MRFLLFFAVFVASAALAVAAGAPKVTLIDSMDIVGDWQVSISKDLAKHTNSVTLWMKSDNDIPGNDPDTPEPLPVTLSITCTTAKPQPEFTVLYPNVVFDNDKQSLTITIDGKAIPFTATVKKHVYGNSSGYLASFTNEDGNRFLKEVLGHQQLTIHINQEHFDIFSGNFSIDHADRAEAALKQCNITP